jgi:Polypeptide deformylase
MAIRPIRLFGDPILLTEAEPVTDFDRSLRQLVKDLTETLRQAGGAGLAAPQIGVGLRVFAYSVNGERGYLVNPTLSFPDEQEQDGPEGCMSFRPVLRRQAAAEHRGPRLHRPRRPGADRRQRHAGPLPPARNRPSRCHLVHRPDGPRHQETRHAGDPRGVVEWS